MPGLNKKPPTVPMAEGVEHYLDQLSKSAVVDLLLDALGRLEGGEPDSVTLEALQSFAGPRLRVRGDREPKPYVPPHWRRVGLDKCAPGCPSCTTSGTPTATDEEVRIASDRHHAEQQERFRRR